MRPDPGGAGTTSTPNADRCPLSVGKLRITQRRRPVEALEELLSDSNVAFLSGRAVTFGGFSGLDTHYDLGESGKRRRRNRDLGGSRQRGQLWEPATVSHQC